MSRSGKNTSKAGLLVLYLAVFVVGGLKLVGYEPGAEAQAPVREPIYDSSMNVDEAIQLATEDGNDKCVLLMLGGNWCGWCYKLHDLLHEDAAIKEVMNERLHLILVDIHSNTWILERFEASPRGYPFLILLDAKGRLLTTQNTDVFVDDTAHNPGRVYEFLREWARDSDQ